MRLCVQAGLVRSRMPSASRHVHERALLFVGGDEDARFLLEQRLAIRMDGAADHDEGRESEPGDALLSGVRAMRRIIRVPSSPAMSTLVTACSGCIGSWVGARCSRAASVRSRSISATIRAAPEE